MPGDHKLTRLILCAAVAVPLLYFGFNSSLRRSIPDTASLPILRACLEPPHRAIPEFSTMARFSVVSLDFSEQPGYFLASPAWQAVGFEP